MRRAAVVVPDDPAADPALAHRPPAQLDQTPGERGYQRQPAVAVERRVDETAGREVARRPPARAQRLNEAAVGGGEVAVGGQAGDVRGRAGQQGVDAVQVVGGVIHGVSQPWAADRGFGSSRRWRSQVDGQPADRLGVDADQLAQVAVLSSSPGRGPSRAWTSGVMRLAEVESLEWPTWSTNS
ncbi:hypothetical protein ACFV84_17000 [Kitasatospora sp. NPDC059811]|uniref:hypothetical protein n=1 Tax=Streptomycetaceae TaxID=2062 RepID=UPI001331826E|nr:hypothetical protein [Streptomyces sp. MJM8645]